MAKKPDGAAAGTQRVTFTKGAAERIGKVVREVEAGNRDQGPLTFGPRVGGASGKVFRICTFTGSWSINASKTVTFKGVTSTPNTVAAVNLFFPIAESVSAADCAIAKDGTSWYLIDVPMEEATAVFAGSTSSQSRVTDVSISAVLNTSNCAITIGKTLTTAAITVIGSTFTSTFLRFKGA